MFRELAVPTGRRTEFVDLTAEVSEAVKGFGLTDGAVTVYVPHTTAGVTINENADPDVLADLEKALENIAPRDGRWAHAEGNADAHVKALLTGSSVTVPVRGGRLQLGTWQGIFLAEFDGPRRRKVLVTGFPS